VVATHFNSLDRVFSTRRDLFHGKSLQALLWGVFASLALCLLLVDLFLIAELLETRGRLVEESDARKYVELFPDEFRLNSDSNDAQAAKADPGSHAAAIARVQQE
jgi:hypothetical protein